MGNNLGNKNLPRNVRREQILKAAVIIASEPQGWMALTRKRIAIRAACSEASVSVHLGTMANVRKAVIKCAVREENLSILSQCFVTHRVTLKPDLRSRVIRSILV